MPIQAGVLAPVSQTTATPPITIEAGNTILNTTRRTVAPRPLAAARRWDSYISLWRSSMSHHIVTPARSLMVVGQDVQTLGQYIFKVILDRRHQVLDSTLAINLLEPDGIWESNATLVDFRAFLPQMLTGLTSFVV